MERNSTIDFPLLRLPYGSVENGFRSMNYLTFRRLRRNLYSLRWSGQTLPGKVRTMPTIRTRSTIMLLRRANLLAACGLLALAGIAQGDPQGDTPAEGEACTLPAVIGPCRGVCPRFFHNTETDQCEPFTFGCCGGNANNFLTLEECEATCDAAATAGAIPAASAWGMIVMLLLVLSAATVVLGKHRVGSELRSPQEL